LIYKLLREESGYSLAEVIVSIFILAIAIIPMVGMFDMGLRTATTGGNYDKARALADTNLEKVRALPYADARSTYGPVDPSVSNTRTVPCTSPSPPPFTCNVTTSYVNNTTFSADPTATVRMQMVVTVEWGVNNSYTTTGLAAL
jgi:Tfp pilus assembly protein PilV